MIVPMLKLTLLCRAADRASALAALRDLGVLHVTPSVAPSGASLDAARAKADLLKRVLEAIPTKTPEGAQKTATDPEKLAADLQALIDTRKTAADRIEALRAETARIAPFGTFDPASIPALAEKGITLKLYRAPLKATPDLPEGVCAEQLGVQKTDGYWALFASSDFTWTGAEEIRLPEHSLSEMEQTISTLTAQLADAEKRFAAAAADRPALEKLLAEAEAAVKFEEVASGMGDAGVVMYVTGFIPARDLSKIETAAATNGWGLLSEQPGPADDVPVLLDQPRWARPIQAVFDGINILPGYKEADVSVVFMLFFSLFFAMIIGDAGYGLIFLALTLLFAKKMPANARNLLLVTSGAPSSGASSPAASSASPKTGSMHTASPNSGPNTSTPCENAPPRTSWACASSLAPSRSPSATSGTSSTFSSRNPPKPSNNSAGSAPPGTCSSWPTTWSSAATWPNTSAPPPP